MSLPDAHGVVGEVDIAVIALGHLLVWFLCEGSWSRGGGSTEKYGMLAGFGTLGGETYI